MPPIEGTENPEQLNGTSEGDAINGRGGDDIITGFGGNDVIHGGEGNDVIQGDPGDDDSDILHGDNGDDNLIVGSGGQDVVHGGAGIDRLGINDANVVGNVTFHAPTANAAGGYDGSYGNGLGRTVTYTSIEYFSVSTGDGNDRVTTAAGNDTVYLRYGDDFVDVGTGQDTADGGIGEDGISADLSGATTGIFWDLLIQHYQGAPGTWFSGFEYFGTVRTGSGNDTIGTSGADRDETIIVGSGDDTVVVRAGHDNVQGGSGNDLLLVDYRAATGSITIPASFVANPSGGFDGVISESGGRSVSFTSIERFEILSGAGNDSLSFGARDDVISAGGGNDVVHGGMGADRIFGEDGSDQLFGDGGDDQLDGGAGADELRGGDGSDIYFVTAGDVLIDDGPTGTDEVRTDASAYSIGSFSTIENLSGTGVVDQTLTGNAGANRIDGGGGVDVMIGGAGDDVYIVSELGDAVQELVGGGMDEVQTALSYSLGDEVENLRLTGFLNVDGFGNGLANTLTGNSGDNLLSGGDGADIIQGGGGFDIFVGGGGADRLVGGSGFDLFFYAATADSADAAVDTIQNFQSGYDLIDLSQTLAVSVSWIASGNTNVVTVNTAYGPMTINVEGSLSLSDFVLSEGLILGTAGNDQLQGTSDPDTLFGGAGADIMSGGLGDDYYVVDNSADQVVEGAGGGFDTVESWVSHVLAVHVDDLLLSGSGAIDGTGNDLDNILFGNAAANVLTGAGGNDLLYGGGGLDILRGGAGDDDYLVDTLGVQIVENRARAWTASKAPSATSSAPTSNI
jgi:Ca2+-binding RTX toxin-like protein